MHLHPSLWGLCFTPAPSLGVLHHVPMGPQVARGTEGGSHGCTTYSGVAPSVPHPCADTGHTRVGGTEGALPPPQWHKGGERRSPRCHIHRMELNGPSSPSQPHAACLSLPSSGRDWSSGEGSGCPGAVLAPQQVPGSSGHGGFGAVKP